MNPATVNRDKQQRLPIAAPLARALVGVAATTLENAP